MRTRQVSHASDFPSNQTMPKGTGIGYRSAGCVPKGDKR